MNWDFDIKSKQKGWGISFLLFLSVTLQNKLSFCNYNSRAINKSISKGSFRLSSFKHSSKEKGVETLKGIKMGKNTKTY